MNAICLIVQRDAFFFVFVFDFVPDFIVIFVGTCAFVLTFAGAFESGLCGEDLKGWFWCCGVVKEQPACVAIACAFDMTGFVIGECDNASFAGLGDKCEKEAALLMVGFVVEAGKNGLRRAQALTEIGVDIICCLGLVMCSGKDDLQCARCARWCGDAGWCLFGEGRAIPAL